MLPRQRAIGADDQVATPSQNMSYWLGSNRLAETVILKSGRLRSSVTSRLHS